MWRISLIFVDSKSTNYALTNPFWPPISDGTVNVYSGGIFNLFGNVVQPRPQNVLVYQQTWINTNTSLPTGTLTRFYVFASNVNAASCTVPSSTYLQIWRPISSASYRLVWQRRVQLTYASLNLGQLYTVCAVLVLGKWCGCVIWLRQ